MKIAVNVRFLLKDKLEGIGWFTYEVLERIVAKHPEHEYIFIFDRPYDESFIFSKSITPVVIPPPARHPFLWYIWFQYSIPYVLKKHKADVFLSPDGFIPLAKGIKSISVIHDINFEPHPEFVPKLTRKFYRKFFPEYASEANEIITVSEFSKNEIIRYYDIDSAKINVAHNGCNSQFKMTDKSVLKIRKLYSDNQSYFLFVGALSPRKNIVTLLQAFDVFRKNNPFEHKLLIVGEKMYLNKQMLSVYNTMEYKNEVIFLGRLKLEHLIDVYSAASAMVFIPFYEGFGIPLLEAMATHTPIIASNIDVFHEVAKDAALFVNPFCPNEVALEMRRLIKNPDLQEELIQKGLKRLEAFSWDKTADKVWEVVERSEK